MLSPNARRLLDKLGIYERIHDSDFCLTRCPFVTSTKMSSTSSTAEARKTSTSRAENKRRKSYERVACGCRIRLEQGIDVIFDSKLVQFAPFLVEKTGQFN